MSSAEKPLHVRVAEALGWTNVHYRMENLDHSCGDIMIADQERMRWKGRAPGEMLVGAAGCSLIPRYDIDWCASGPLIERFRIDLHPPSQPDGCEPWCLWDAEWEDIHLDEASPLIEGTTPLIAICNLVLAFKAAGVTRE